MMGAYTQHLVAEAAKARAEIERRRIEPLDRIARALERIVDVLDGTGGESFWEGFGKGVLRAGRFPAVAGTKPEDLE
jgi:hypothetical protein